MFLVYYYLTLILFICFCAVYQFKNFALQSDKSKDFSTFQKKYLIVYYIVMCMFFSYIIYLILFNLPSFRLVTRSLYLCLICSIWLSKECYCLIIYHRLWIKVSPFILLSLVLYLEHS